MNDPFFWRTLEPTPRMRHMERKALLQYLEAVPDPDRSVEDRMAEIEKRFAENRKRKPPTIAAKEVTGNAFRLFKQRQTRRGRIAALVEESQDISRRVSRGEIKASDFIPRLTEIGRTVDRLRKRGKKTVIAFNYYPTINVPLEDGSTDEIPDLAMKNAAKRERRARRGK